jgi:hypothetical protein
VYESGCAMRCCVMRWTIVGNGNRAPRGRGALQQ